MIRLLFLLLLVGCAKPITVQKAQAPQVSAVPWCFGAKIAWKQETKEGPLKDIVVESRSCFSHKTVCEKAVKLASTYASLAKIKNVTGCTDK